MYSTHKSFAPQHFLLSFSQGLKLVGTTCASAEDSTAPVAN